MLKKINLFAEAAFDVIQGRKIHISPDTQLMRERYIQILRRMHDAHLIPAEPQSYVMHEAYAGVDPKYMGKTAYHPVSEALFQEAESLRLLVAARGKDVIPFEILGLNWDKRVLARQGEAYQADPGKALVLTCGDNVSLYQALRIIRDRLQHPDVAYTTPLIIQNTDHFWEGIFNTGSRDWPAQRAELRALNVHHSSGSAETADLLGSLPGLNRVPADRLHFDLGSYEGGSFDHAFATTDLLKFDQTQLGFKDLMTGGKMRRLLDIVGPFTSPTEESYSYEGNAEDEKMRAVYNLFRTLGTGVVRSYFADHDYRNPDQINILAHDGGLGFFMESKDGKRRIDLFTAEHFPNSIHKLNPMQEQPGVELAYLKRTDGLEVTMERLWNRVFEICAEDPSFSPDDLRANDSSLFVSCRLNRMLAAIDRGEDYDAVRLGVVGVFSRQILRVARQPVYPVASPNLVPETENYLIPPGQPRTRSEIPNWSADGPNASSYRILHKFINEVDTVSDRALAPSVRNKRRQVIRMGMLGAPDLLLGRTLSADFNAVKSLLRERGISTQQGPDVWREYLDDPFYAFYGASRGPTNSYYLEGMRRMLNESSILYYGKTKRPLTDEEKVKAYLLMCKTVARNQLSNRREIVADREAVAEFMELLVHRQMLGLVGQQTRHLLTLSDGPEDSADKIEQLVRTGIPKYTPVRRHFHQNEEVENHQCMVVTVYLSASNCNKEAIDLVTRLGYLTAVNGFTLKTGGGNDGLMKAVNDGFLLGKQELQNKGYDFPNQLINIQCVDTEAIEKPYEGGGIYRCHPDIESRKADLQNSDFSVAAPGGIGTDEEIFAWMRSVLDGLIDQEDHPFCLMNTPMDSPKGKIGVHEPYRKMFSESFLRRLNMSWKFSCEGVIDQACGLRISRNAQPSVTPDTELYSLRDEMRKAAGVLGTRHFMPPYDIYLGEIGKLPPANIVVETVVGHAAQRPA